MKIKYFGFLTVFLIVAMIFQNCGDIKLDLKKVDMDSQDSPPTDMFLFSRFEGPNSEIWQYKNGAVSLFQKASGISYFSQQVGKKIYFDGSDTTHGIEPWVYDTTSNEIKMIADLAPGATDGYFENPLLYKDEIYFVGRFYQLYKMGTDGVPKFLRTLSDSLSNYRSCVGIYEDNLICIGSGSVYLYNVNDLSEKIYASSYTGGGLNSPVFLNNNLYLIYSSVNGDIAVNKLVKFNLPSKTISTINFTENDLRFLTQADNKLFIFGYQKYWVFNEATQTFTKMDTSNLITIDTPFLLNNKFVSAATVIGHDHVLTSIVPGTGQYEILWEKVNEHVFKVYKSPDKDIVLFIAYIYPPQNFCDYKLYSINLNTRDTKLLTDQVCPK